MKVLDVSSALDSGCVHEVKTSLKNSLPATNVSVFKSEQHVAGRAASWEHATASSRELHREDLLRRGGPAAARQSHIDHWVLNRPDSKCHR